MENQSYNHVFKVVLSGAPEVGKSNILLRFIDDGFKAKEFTRGGAIFKQKIVKIKDENIFVQMWDIPGKTAYSSNIANYF